MTAGTRPASHIKKVGVNALIYGAGLMLVRLGSFLLIPLYTHALTVSEYGVLCTLQVTMELLFVAMHLGLRTAVMRFERDHGNTGDAGSLLGSAVILNLVGGLVVTGIAVTFLQPLFRSVLHMSDVGGLVLLTCLSALGYSVFIVVISHYRATQQAVKYVIASVACTVLMVCATVVVLRVLHGGVAMVMAAMALSYSLMAGAVMALVLRSTGFQFSFTLAKKLWRFGCPLILVMSGSLVMEASTLYILGYVRELSDVAVYSLGGKLATMAYVIVVSPFQIAYEPFVFAHIHEPAGRQAVSRLLTYLSACFVIVSLGLVVAARWLLPFIAPPEYAAAFGILVMLLPSVAFLGVYYVGESLMSAAHRNGELAFIVVTFAVISILLNGALIPWWGIAGALITRNLVSMIRAWLVLHRGLVSYPAQIEIRRLTICVVAFIVPMAVALLLRKQSAIWMTGVSAILCGGVIWLIGKGAFLDQGERAAIRDLLRRIPWIRT